MNQTTGIPDSPYKGLMPYSEEDAAFFFGREAERDIIGANLQASRLTLVYGASGVGKSSVLRAGVAHHLRQTAQRELAEEGKCDFVVVVFSSWRDDPVASLIERIRDSFAKALGNTALDGVPASPSLAETLNSLSSHGDVEMLIILDQFEEYFLYHPQEDDEGTFATEFSRAVNRPGLRANFLISIREDAVAKLDWFKGRIPTLFHNYLRVDHLDRESTRAAIEKPLEQLNKLRPGAPAISIEEELTEAVLDQVRTGQVILGETGSKGIGSEERIETPYLQLVMNRLWKEEAKTASNVLRLATLNRLQGADRIVRSHLDEVMSALSSREQEVAARTFRYLVTSSGTKIAHTISDLADYAEVPQAQLAPVLEKLSSGSIRILRPIMPSSGQASLPRYEIFHDVLAPAILDWRQRAETRRLVEVERGLKPLHKRIWSASRQFGMASFLLAAPLLLAIMEDPESPRWVLPGWFLGLVIMFGFAALLTASGQGINLYRAVTRALKLGFRWRAVLEVMSDNRGDLGSLITGRDNYECLNPARRDRIRTVRCMKAIAALLVGILPVLGLFGVVTLGSRRLLDPSYTFLLVAGPSVVLLIARVMAGIWEGMVRYRARRLAKKPEKAGSTTRHLATPSFDEFEGIFPHRSPDRSAHIALLIPVALAAFLAAATLLVIPVVFVTILGPSLLEDRASLLQRSVPSLKIRDVGQPYRLPADPAISKLRAGQAYYTLGVVNSRLEKRDFELPVPKPIEDQWIPEKNPLGNSLVFENVLGRAVRGFTPEELRYLERVAAHPGFAEFSIVARASEMDYLGARFKTLRPSALWTLPWTSLQQLGLAGQAHVAKAALELSRGRKTEAEYALLETISFGLLQIDEGPFLFDALMGARNVETGLAALEDFYSLTGEDTKAHTIRTGRDTSAVVNEDLKRFAPATKADIAGFRKMLVETIQDPKQVRGLRWEGLALLSTVSCTNARELVFGPSQELEQAFENARKTLVRSPIEQELFEKVSSVRGLYADDPFTQVETPALALAATGLSGLAGKVFHNDRMAPCVELARVAQAFYWR